MSGTAPYAVDVTGSDDETFSFTLPFEKADGTAFPFDQYAIEYSVAGQFALSQGSGITINAPDVTFKAAQSLCKGTYQHGCRLRDLSTGVVSQVFDGSITIGEGNF